MPGRDITESPVMILLHGAVLSGADAPVSFALWGETPPADMGTARKRARRGADAGQGNRPGTPRQPYGVQGDVLADRLAEAVAGLNKRELQQERAIVWLPTADGVPLPSSPLIGETPSPVGRALALPGQETREATLTLPGQDAGAAILGINAQGTAGEPGGKAATLAPWTIDAIRLPTEAAVTLLCHCVERDTLAPGVIISNDLRFWATIMRFAGTLVTRQLFLPGLQMDADGYWAQWEPLIAGRDETLLKQLAQAMPPVCRALSWDATQAPALAARAVLTHFVSAVVDHLVRAPAINGREREIPAIYGCEREPTAASARDSKKGKPPRAFASVHDQWLSALRAPDGCMTGDLRELAAFAAQLRDWRRRLDLRQDTSFRLCFRLEEPASDSPFPIREGGGGVRSWYVHYLLQATDDPSLLVPAEEVWQSGRRSALIARHIASPREKLLAVLGQAAAISPPIEASLRTAAPRGYALDAAGAHTFLTETAWLLEQAGFGVLLSAWWTRKGTKLKLAARAFVKSPKMTGSGISMESLVTFDWQIALGDQVLSYQDLEALARLKAPLVQIRGQWVQVNADEIQTALDFWKKKGSDQLKLREIVQMALDPDARVGGFPVESVQAEGWIAELLERLNGQGAYEDIPVPAALRGILRPYQRRGYAWLHFLTQWGLGACLADDVGLGKMVQTLTLIQRERDESLENTHQPVLLICPTSVVQNWKKEAERFTPELPVMIHHGLGRRKGAAFPQEAARHALVVSSYGLLYRDLDILKQVPWRGVVLDEAQNIKNPETKQAKAARAIPADYHVALTGTPVENNVGDLWSIMEFLNPGFLGTQAAFRRQFFLPIQTVHDPESTDRLKRLTGPFILRRLKTDPTIIDDLPEKMEMKMFCPLTKEQASLYAAVLKELEEGLEEAEGIQRKGMILGTLSKLKQVCNHPAHFLGDNSPLPGRSGKLARLEEMLEEALAAGDCVLIFTQFAEMGKLLKQHLQSAFGREALFLHGGVAKPPRDRMVERFQSTADGPPIFILSLKAGGTGLNLTRANHVFHFDRWWNPAVENQATDRAFRIGQTKRVQVHKFICAGTLEERIDAMIESKQEIAANIVGAGEGWLTELSTAQIKDLFALRREAVEV
jgi:SNF2 family DNA or RNA helicase